MHRSRLFPILGLIGVLFLVTPVMAQLDQSTGQLLSIHEDHVVPSMAAQYETAIKSLRDQLTKHRISNLVFIAATMDDFTYFYVTPIDNLGSVAAMGRAFDELEQKMGKGPYQKAINRIANCYTSHRNFAVRYREDLSYIPEGAANPKTELNYRTWNFYYLHAGQEAKAIELARKWKKLYTDRKIKYGYRIYLGEYGSDMPVLIAVSEGKSASDIFRNSEIVRRQLGEAGRTLRAETFQIVRRFDSKSGRMRPDLSYQPDPAISKK